MSATKLFAAGYTDLVSVMPPGAEISPNSRIDLRQRGKVPGLKGTNGWYGYPFTKSPADAISARMWDRWGSNVGLLGDRFPSVDIDIDDRDLSVRVGQYLTGKLGRGPVRLSRHPRMLLVFRTEVPFAKMALVISKDDQHHKVEILGEGRQYLVHGTHPSGVEYRFHGRPLWEVPPEELTLITKEGVIEALVGLATELTADGYECEVIGDGRSASESAPPQEDLAAPSPKELSDLMTLIPNPADSGRDHYIQVGYAVKAAGQEDPELAFEDWSAWADRWEGDGNADPEADRREWERFHPPFRAGWSWLQSLAEKDGEYMTAQHEFKADPNAVPPPPVTPKREKYTLDHSRLTDAGGAKALMPILEGDILHTANGWYLKQDNTWVQGEADLTILAEAEDLANSLFEEYERAPNKKEAQPLATYAKRLLSFSGLRGLTGVLQTLLRGEVDDFDSEPMHLNTPGGAFDLRTGENIGAGNGMYARATGVTPEPGEAPYWLRFLRDVTGGDQEMIDYIQIMLGYILTGDTNEKAFWFIHGNDADTGKSTFVRIINHVLGGYAATVNIDAFAGNRDVAHTGIAGLVGTRFVTANEPSIGRVWNEEIIKTITGGDDLQARELHKKPFTFTPQFSIMVVGNNEPELQQVDSAMTRRLNILPFTYPVPPEKRVPGLDLKLFEKEGAAILHWMMEGTRIWMERGLTRPKVVQVRVDEYAGDEDLVTQWIEEDCDLGEDYAVSAQELNASWTQWCNRNGEKVDGGVKKLRKRLAPYRFGRAKVPGDNGSYIAGYQGIRVTPDGAER